MRFGQKAENEDLSAFIEALLDEGETLLWWDKFSDKAIVSGFGKSLMLLALVVNGLILLLIFAPSLLPETASLGWLLVPLLLVDCVCLLFILLYFAFGLMTGGVNVITDQRVVVADLRAKKIVREIRLDSLRAVTVRRSPHNRGDIVFLRRPAPAEKTSSRQPMRLAMSGLRHFDRVLELLRDTTDLLDDSGDAR